MLYLTCAMISSVDLAHYGVSLAKDWVSVDCGTKFCVHGVELCIAVECTTTAKVQCRHEHKHC